MGLILKFLGGFLGTLAAKILAYFAIERAGEQKQQARDEQATGAAIQRERDALVNTPSSKAEALKRLRNGDA